MTRIEADRVALELARRAQGDGERLLSGLADLDHEMREMVKARLMERGAEAVLRESAAA